MRDLLTVIATAAIMACGLIWEAEAATMAEPIISKNYASVEKVAYWRRQFLANCRCVPDLYQVRLTGQRRRFGLYTRGGGRTSKLSSPGSDPVCD